MRVLRYLEWLDHKSEHYQECWIIHENRRLRVIDYETTGVPGDKATEVIELVDVDPGTLRITESWRSFAKPIGPIPPQVKAVNHILEEYVAEAPTIDELWPLLFQSCGPHDIRVAHNASF